MMLYIDIHKICVYIRIIIIRMMQMYIEWHVGRCLGLALFVYKGISELWHIITVMLARKNM